MEIQYPAHEKGNFDFLGIFWLPDESDVFRGSSGCFKENLMGQLILENFQFVLVFAVIFVVLVIIISVLMMASQSSRKEEKRKKNGNNINPN